MAKIVLCLVLAVTMVVAAHARVYSDPNAFAAFREERSTQPGRLVKNPESFGSTELVQRVSYQTAPYDLDRMQEDTSRVTDSYSDSFATETYPSSFPEENSFSTETNYVNPSQGVGYNYAVDSNPDYDQGLAARRAGTGATGGETEKAASFTLEGNTDKTETVEWTESSDP